MRDVRSLNRVMLVGRVGRAPEITHIPNSERSVAKFSLATSEGYMDKTNQWQEMTEWHNIVFWGKNVDWVERTVAKGQLTLIEGKIKTRKWQDKQSGQNRYSTEIYADKIVVLDKQNRPTDGYSGGDQPPAGTGQFRNSGTKGKEQTQAPPVQDINEFPYDEGDNDPF